MSTPNFLQVKYQGINIPNQTTSTAASSGDIGYNSTVNKFDVWNTAADFIVTELTAQTLSNKTINASTNTISNITNANLSGSAGITNANLAQMAANTVKANTTGSSALPSDVALGTVTEATSAVLTLTGWSDATIGSPTIQVAQSTTSTSGYLSSTDWNTFNNKQPAGSYITALTGQVTASGPGSATATIATNTVSNSNLAQMPADTIKGNNTGSTANASDLTVAQVNAILPVFTSSLNGLVPASGGGTANFLRADGTWNPAPGTVTSVGLAAPAIFTVTNSPVTSSGTLTLSYSGSALPIANGGTNATTAAAAYNNLSPMTTTGDMEYEASAGVAARLPIGTSGQVLAVQSGLPSWIDPSIVGSIVASYAVTTGATSAVNTQINFDTKLVDTNNAVTTGAGTWKFTAPIAGNYLVSSSLYLNAAGNASIAVWKNGSAYAVLGLAVNANSSMSSVMIPMNSGDYIDIRSTNNSMVTTGPSGGEWYETVSIMLATGSSTVAPVVAFANNTAGGTYTANTTFPFTNVVIDTNSGFSAGVYTIPISGYYSIDVTMYLATAGGDVSIFQNGTAISAATGITANTSACPSAIANCMAGDTILVKIDTRQSVTASAPAFYNISIKQVH